MTKKVFHIHKQTENFEVEHFIKKILPEEIELFAEECKNCIIFEYILIFNAINNAVFKSYFISYAAKFLDT